MNVLQPWVQELTMMQQSVLIAAVRGPDGLRKNHPVKVLMRWYRRSFLVSAMNRRIYTDPFEKGGGSFTGPFEKHHAQDMGLTEVHNVGWATLDRVRGVYLNHVDEIPHHFQLHLMHAAEILGYKHPEARVRDWWREFYEMIVRDAHLTPETEEEMDFRLGDRESQWRACEVTTAD